MMRLPSRTVLVALGSLAVGCGVASSGAGEAEDATNTTTSAARRGEERVDGVYEVPTSPELAYAASNPVTVKLRDIREDGFRLKYDLPPVIAGFDRDVDLTARRVGDGAWELSGPAGTGSCVETDGDFVCQEDLRGVPMSLAEAKLAVEALPVSPAERQARLDIADEFTIDPLGVVKFRWPGR